jgi:vancomycin resistance protein YoaR
MVVLAYDYNHAGKVYPGVSVAGVDLSGLTPPEAAARLAQILTYPDQGKIAFKDGERVWIARPSDLGLFLDPQASALAAYSLGRRGDPISRAAHQFRAWYVGEELAPLLVYDQRMARQYLEGVAKEVNRPTIEAALNINGVQVEATPGQVGRELNISATLAPLEEQLRSFKDGLVPVVMTETPPAILDARAQAEIARKILSAPLTLSIPAEAAAPGDPGPWTFEPDKLARMITVQRVETPQGADYQVSVDAGGLRAFLEEQVPKLSRNAEDARFIFNDDTRQLEIFEHAIVGRSLDVEATLLAINQKLPQGEHDLILVFNINQPTVPDNVNAEQLGIRELVSEQTSYFYGSSGSRIQNIKTAAGRFHGVMVPPGAIFSMAAVMGDVSLDAGYAEALIIFGNRTIKGVGGGVCQVSTTLFRTVFFGGYPVVERYPHAYRVIYYEFDRGGNVNSDMAGLDATVFVPVVDFKFQNDTPHWLLMETYVNANARTLTWKFYSTSTGRSVDWNTSGLQNVEDPPEPQYIENPELARGEINQVDWEVAGADVTVTRTVYQNGQVYIQDAYVTHYMPWRSVFEYGPGTKLPGEGKPDKVP